jgi:membrane protease YdiL (CAAX protease family)
MIPILAAMVDITGSEEGGHVVIDPPVAIGALYLFLLLLPLLFVLAFLFYRKKLQHQQILVAIEKGVPVSDLIARPRNEINWVKNLAAGIGLLFIGVVSAVLIIYMITSPNMMTRSRTVVEQAKLIWLIIPTAICGFGLIFLLRGIFQRSHEKNRQTK